VDTAGEATLASVPKVEVRGGAVLLTIRGSRYDALFHANIEGEGLKRRRKVPFRSKERMKNRNCPS